VLDELLYGGIKSKDNQRQSEKEKGAIDGL
jgi:hypothetical protein